MFRSVRMKQAAEILNIEILDEKSNRIKSNRKLSAVKRTRIDVVNEKSLKTHKLCYIFQTERERSPIFPIFRFLQKLYEAISFKMPTIYYVFDSTFAIQPTLIKIERGKCNFTKWNTRKTTSPAKKSEINDEMFTDFRILHSRFHTACSMRDRKKMYYEVFFWPRLFVFWIRRFASEMSSSIWKDAWSSAENNVAVARGVCRFFFFSIEIFP